MNLDFLKNAELEVATPAAKTSRTVAAKNPENGADLRVYKNGKIYPSAEFVQANNLEYAPQVQVDGNASHTTGNALDIFSSINWGMIKGTLEREAMFIAVVEKTEKKVDLFGSTKYDEEGNPKSSVMTQGGGSYGKTILVPMLTEVYGIDWETTDFVDLKVVTDITMTSPNGVYALPKLIARGEKKGQATYEIRKNITVNPLIPFEEVTGEPEPEATLDANLTSEEIAAANEVNVDFEEVTGEAEPQTFETADEVGTDAEFDADPFASIPGVSEEASTDPGEDWANNLGNA